MAELASPLRRNIDPGSCIIFNQFFKLPARMFIRVLYLCIQVIFDTYIEDVSFYVVTNEKLSVSEAACNRWTSVGAVIRVETNAANCGENLNGNF